MKFEIKLLKGIALAHVVVGLAITSLVFMEQIHPFILDTLYSHQIENSKQIIFWISIFGPTLASWGILFYLAIKNYSAHPNLDSYRLMHYSLLVWAPLDTALCLYNDIWLGAILNIIVLLAFLFLLMRIKFMAYVNCE